MSDHVRTVACNTNNATFVFEVTRATMRDHVVATWGTWDDLDQRRRSDSSFNLVTHELIVIGDATAGVLAVTRQSDQLYIDKLYLLPEFQRRGIGTILIERLKAEARARGVPLRLHVLRVNPAGALYRRLGFRIVRDTPERVYFEVQPSSD